MNRRQGMILVESSGEYDTLAKLHELAATDSESEEGEGCVDYNLVESSSPSSVDDGSYHSDNDEIVEYWDPYCKSLTGLVTALSFTIALDELLMCS